MFREKQKYGSEVVKLPPICEKLKLEREKRNTNILNYNGKEIVEKKLNDIPNLEEEKQEKLQACEDAKMLTILNRKVVKNISLTKEEQEFIFEINREIKSFGWDEDERIAKIKEEIVIENYEIAMKIIKMNGLNLQYASDKIKKDKEVVLAAVTRSGNALKYASDKLKKDEEVVFFRKRILFN